MDINSILEVLDVQKFKASILSDLIDGDLLDKLYAAVKPSLLKAIKDATA
jgi:hypothetical protein